MRMFGWPGAPGYETDHTNRFLIELGLEGIVSKKLDAPYRSGPSKAWIKVKIQRHRPRLARMEPSNISQFVLVSARKSRGAEHWSKDDYDVRLDERPWTSSRPYHASPASKASL